MKKFLHSEKRNYFDIDVDWQNGTVLSSKIIFVQKYALTGHENLSTWYYATLWTAREKSLIKIMRNSDHQCENNFSKAFDCIYHTILHFSLFFCLVTHIT